MKKLSTLFMAVLLVWNIFLTYQWYHLQKNANSNNQEKTVIDQTVSKITTDLTKIIENSEAKVVSVSNYRNNNLVATGSGVIYQTNGEEVLVVTNYHVVENGTSFKVRFASGEQLDAERVGFDLLTDIAVLRIRPEFTVTPFKMGDSSLTSVGEYVIAIGSPLGVEFQGSATFGIISGKDRLIAVDLNNDGVDDWDSILLQTDAAINPGNSGGALVNLAGELIGITSMKMSNYNVEGMGFAIPINEVVSIVEQIKENGSVKRPLLGISAIGVSDMTNYEKNYYRIDLSINQGILVTSVAAGSAADKAGIKVGDIIIKMDDVGINTFKQFRIELYKKNINQKISVEIKRGNQNLTFDAVLTST